MNSVSTATYSAFARVLQKAARSSVVVISFIGGDLWRAQGRERRPVRSFEGGRGRATRQRGHGERQGRGARSCARYPQERVGRRGAPRPGASGAIEGRAAAEPGLPGERRRARGAAVE